MAIMRRLHKTSTAKMLSLPCFPPLVDLIVLSGFLSLEYPSFLYITYSYGYHQKTWQQPALLKCLPCRVFPRWLIWSYWGDSFRWQLHLVAWQNQRWNLCLPYIWPIHMVIIRRLGKTSTVKMLNLPCLPSLADLIALSTFLPLETPLSLYITYTHVNHQKAWQNQHCENAYLTVSSFSGCFIVLSGFHPLTTPPSISPIHMAIIRRHDKTLLKCLPCCAFLRWLIRSYWVNSFRWKPHYLSIHMSAWQSKNW